MVTAFQIILLFIVFVGFAGMVGEKEDTNLRNNLTAVSIAGMAAFIVSVIWL